MGFRDGQIRFSKGAIEGGNLELYLHEITRPADDIASFDALPTPFRAIATDMVTGKSSSTTHYFPERVNRPDSPTLVGQSSDQNHMANFVDCVRTRERPNASVEIGYLSAVAGHMANLSYRHKKRVTLEDAKSIQEISRQDHELSNLT